MSTEVKRAQPSPELFFETANAFQRTAALKAAIELDLFTAIGAIGPAQATPKAVAAKCGASEKGIRVLCDFLTVVGFLTKSGKSYALTLDAATFLDRRSPACIASAIDFLNSPLIMQHYTDVAAVVRKGGTASTQSIIAPENPIWVEFARAMAPMMSMPAGLIAGVLNAEAAPKWKVLDIAAGHGLFGITLAAKNRNAEVTAVDWPNVLELAKTNAAKNGVEGRYRTLPGDAFQVDYGTGYDVVLLTNFLHHFDRATNEALLRKVHAALAPGGRAVALEFVPNDDRVTPGMVATFALIMLASTPAGDAYTFAEYQAMFRNAGFRASELHALPPTFQHLIVAHK